MAIYLNILEHLGILQSTKDPICYQKHKNVKILQRTNRKIINY